MFTLEKSEEINEEIIQLCEEIVDKRLKMEIKTTIVKTLVSKYTTAEIEKYIDHFINYNPDIPTGILNIVFVVSYYI